MGRQIKNFDEDFWCEAQKTARYYAWKHGEQSLTNLELSAYCKLLSLLEKMYARGLQQFEDDEEDGNYPT